MFARLCEHGGDLTIKNKQGYTPLTLAADMARKEVTLSKFIHHKKSKSIKKHQN
jgi:hypothetical protein